MTTFSLIYTLHRRVLIDLEGGRSSQKIICFANAIFVICLISYENIFYLLCNCFINFEVLKIVLKASFIQLCDVTYALDVQVLKTKVHRCRVDRLTTGKVHVQSPIRLYCF